MDELDQFIIGRELAGGWVVEASREIHRDAASACRCYLARTKHDHTAFVKVLDPRANGSLQAAQRQLEQFIYERHIIDVCAERDVALPCLRMRLATTRAGGQRAAAGPDRRGWTYTIVSLIACSRRRGA
jgi:hypothetical protein